MRYIALCLIIALFLGGCVSTQKTEPSIRVKCPKCGSIFDIEERAKKVKCPDCEEIFYTSVGEELYIDQKFAKTDSKIKVTADEALHLSPDKLKNEVK